MSGESTGSGPEDRTSSSLPQDLSGGERLTPNWHSSDVEKEDNAGGGRGGMNYSQADGPPALPNRPSLSMVPSSGSLRISQKPSRPQLLSHATTALSLADVHTQSRLDPGSLRSSPASRTVSRKHSFSHLDRFVDNSHSGGDSAASLRSYAPTLDTRTDEDSFLVAGDGRDSSSWKASESDDQFDAPEEFALPNDGVLEAQFSREFDDLVLTTDDRSGEDTLLREWKSRLKHFFILSASGKPIYSRHGDDRLIGHYVGVVQTLIAFYESSSDALESFTAGDTRFVILSKGPLNLVAVSRLGESASQLRTQLESLYMQILSSLTLPSMEKMFSARPSTDLRRPLQGTDVLLDGLADGFTRGSLSTLLSALECLRLRKTDRRAINESLLAVRSPELLYGLIVAGGRLVSVLRPKKHSLHPGDLHLIFNMLFEAGSVRAGEGENWIPICLPGFNNTGFLYMYVSFLPSLAATTEETNKQQPSTGQGNELAIVFISPSKEAFYSLRTMRDEFLSSLRKTKTLSSLHDAISRPRPTCPELFGNTPLKHFLYKSRGNVQFTMSSFEPHFPTTVARRKLISLYGHLHENIHSRTSHLKIQHAVSTEATALAWETPLFELYCVAAPGAARESLVQGANRVVQWVRKEEERVFIIGGAVF